MKKLSFLILCCLVIGWIFPAYSAGNKPSKPSDTYQININQKTEPINFRLYNDGNYRFSWVIKDNKIEITISARTLGWVAIGLNPSVRMKDADIYFGFVDQKGKGQAFDMFSIGETGPHPSDTDLGGQNDLISPSVSIINGWTTFTFQRKLDTGDRFDKPILLDKPMKVLWSMGMAKDTTMYHAVRGFVTINFTKPSDTATIPATPGTIQEPNQNQQNLKEKSSKIQILLKFHLFFMILGFLLLCTALSMIYVFKKKTWWFQYHRIIGFFSFAFIVTGFCFAIKLASVIGQGHFNIIHGKIGLVVVEITSILMIISILYLNTKKHQKLSLLKKLRTVHIWIARFIILLLISNVFLGIMLAQSFLRK